MSKLYPPVIEGTIPAFNKDTDGTITLMVPFSMNRSVSKADIKGFSVKVKTIQSNSFVITLNNGQLRDGYAEFEISGSSWTPKPGQYYKLQLAYIGVNNEVGYYSTVGVVKYTTINNSNLTIEGLDASVRNIFKHEYTGVYEHGDDPVEKAYQYRFVLYKDGEIDTDSGWLLHNAIADAATDTSVDAYEFFDDLDEDSDYSLQYQIITTNLLTIQTPAYPLSPMPEFEALIDFDFSAKLNADNGYIQLSLQGEDDSTGQEKNVEGKFKIYRSNVKTPRRWEPVFNFVLQNESPSKIGWLKDFTVEHGETYKYKICQYNDAGIVTTGAYTEEIYVDFEDMFLFDGVRQLRVQFDPKVSSFKNDILESKLDTIGSKYPFFFRNGHVHYKEFPISGLISYWIDDEQLFKPLEEMYLEDENLVRKSTPSAEGLDRRRPDWTQDNWGKGKDYAYDHHFKTFNLLNYNMAAEKKFKLDVLEWLTNGKPKLFRSPAEGNYIVRLMNTTLTPNDTLSRMIHSFQCTAYEIDDANYRNLGMYGFLNGGGDGEGGGGIDDPLNDEPKLRFKTVKLRKIAEEQGALSSRKSSSNMVEALLSDGEMATAQSIFIEDCEYGDVFYIDGQEVHIGITQSYNIDNLHEISSVKFDPAQIHALTREADPYSQFADIDPEPQITYSYFANFVGNSLFDQITELSIGNEPAKQLTYDGPIPSDTSFVEKNLIKDLQNDNVEIINYPYIAFERAPVEEIYTLVDFNNFDPEQPGITDDNFNKLFTFDKTGWGRKATVILNNEVTDASNDALETIKNLPFYIFKIKPITFSNVDFAIDLPEIEIFIDETLGRYSYPPEILEEFKINPTEELYKTIVNWEGVGLFQEDKDKMWKYVQYYKFILGFISESYTEYAPDSDPEGKNRAKIHYRLIRTNSEIIDDVETIHSEYVEDTSAIHFDTNNNYWVFADNEIAYLPFVRTETKVDLVNFHFLYDFNLVSFDEDWYLIYKDEKIKFFNGDEYSTRIYMNTGKEDGLEESDLDELPYLDVKDTVQPIVFYNLAKITDLYFSYGVICSLSYNTINKNYRFEDDDETIKNAKQKYLDAVAEYKRLVEEYPSGDPKVDPAEEMVSTEQTIAEYIDQAYDEYTQAVSAYIVKWKEENQPDEH